MSMPGPCWQRWESMVVRDYAHFSQTWPADSQGSLMQWYLGHDRRLQHPRCIVLLILHARFVVSSLDTAVAVVRLRPQLLP